MMGDRDGGDGAIGTVSPASPGINDTRWRPSGRSGTGRRPARRSGPASPLLAWGLALGFTVMAHVPAGHATDLTQLNQQSGQDITAIMQQLNGDAEAATSAARASGSPAGGRLCDAAAIAASAATDIICIIAGNRAGAGQAAVSGPGDDSAPPSDPPTLGEAVESILAGPR